MFSHVVADNFSIFASFCPFKNILVGVNHNNRLAVYFLYRHANICQTARFACLCGFRFGICFLSVSARVFFAHIFVHLRYAYTAAGLVHRLCKQLFRPAQISHVLAASSARSKAAYLFFDTEKADG